MALLLLLPAFAGCLDSGEPAQPALAASVSMAPGELIGGTFQPVEFTARQPLSLLVPYPVRDFITGLCRTAPCSVLARPQHSGSDFKTACCIRRKLLLRTCLCTRHLNLIRLRLQ